MRSFGMYDASRGLTLAFAAALAGLGLWGATQVGTQTQGRYWLAMAIVAGAGLLLALANHVGTWTKGLRVRMSPGTFVLAFLPVLVCVGWLLLSAQPGSGWQEARIDSWSNSIGILGLVHALGLWRGALAFGVGLMLGLSLDGVPAAEPVAVPVPGYTGATGNPAADEPVAAERRWGSRRTRASPAGETTQTRERTPSA